MNNGSNADEQQLIAAPMKVSKNFVAFFAEK